MKYKITQPQKNIFHVLFSDQYDMAMTFLRYQEYYESPNKRFRGRIAWSILEYMEWYSKDHNNVFSYPDDWAGFNIPHRVVSELRSHAHQVHIPDPNKYDDEMYRIYEHCRRLSAGQDFYIIASLKSDAGSKNHEIAHGLYYLNPGYKKEMDALVTKLRPATKKFLKDQLKAIGYDSSVFADEVQAYFSTSTPPPAFASALNQEERNNFTDVFERHTAKKKPRTTKRK
jgi:hypothetical protein